MSTHPDEIHGYTILEVLTVNPQDGRVAYLARDGDGRRVVLKRFTIVGFDASWAGFEEQEREIQVLRELEHPQIPAYVDHFTTDDGLCLVQQWMDVPSLGSRTSFSPDEVKAIALSLLGILTYLQERLPPVIHRDIKPDNVLVDDDGRAFLVDFGLARAGAGTASTIAVGTPGFMAPEQMLGRQLTPATDLFGVGATLIAMLTGTPSHQLGELLDTSMRFDLGRLPKGLAPAFVRWVETMVAADPAERFADARAARQALVGLTVRGHDEPARSFGEDHPSPVSSPSAAVATTVATPVLTFVVVGVVGVVGVVVLAAIAAEPDLDPHHPPTPSTVAGPTPPAPRPLVRPEPRPAPEPPPPRARTIRCSEAMTLTELPQPVNDELGIEAYPGCMLSLEGITLAAKTGILVESGADVTLVDSTITATEIGLEVRGGGMVTLTRSSVTAPTAASVTRGGTIVRGAESTLDGETIVDEKSWIYGDDPEADGARRLEERLERYKKGACGGVSDCQRKQRFQGTLKFELRADVAADGTVGKVRIKGKRPPRELAKCIIESAKTTPIPDYVAEDGPGVRICEMDATFQGFMTSWGSSSRYELKR